VEEAFYTTDRVMTLSFHKYGEYFPGTGDLRVNFSSLLCSVLSYAVDDAHTPCSEKSNIFIFTIYFSQFLGKFYETFSEYP